MNPKKEEVATLLDILALFSAGRVTITVGGNPVLSARLEEKELDVEVSGAKGAGLSLSQIFDLQGGSKNVLIGSERIATKLSRMGWKLALYDKGRGLLTMGSGVSRLTGHIRANPLNLRRLLEELG